MLVWLALAIAVVSFVGSVVYGTLKGLEVFRAVKRLGGAVGGELDRIAATSEQIERHLALASESSTRLDASLTRLRTSHARLNVLRSALADVQDAAGRITSVYPRK